MRARVLPILVAALALSGCGGHESSPTAPSPPTEVPPPVRKGPPPPGTISLRVVNALDSGAIPGAVIDIADMGRFETAGDGTVELAPLSPAVRQIRVNAPSYFERTTSLRFEQQTSITPVSLSLIPSSFDLVLFDGIFRFPAGAGLLTRWLANPVLRLNTSIFWNIVGVSRATEFTLSLEVLGCIETHLKAALADMSGGALRFASTVVLPPLAEFTNEPPAAAGAVTFTAVLQGHCFSSSHGCGEVVTNQNGSVSSGRVRLVGTPTSCASLPSRDTFQHELGHALGLRDGGTQSVMGLGSVRTFTEFDRQAISIQYQRPPGNRSPDTDPDTFSVN